MPKTSDVVAERLRTQILRGHLDPGTPLASEAELIESYGVSRATVREALRLLEAEGLITIRRGSRGGIAVAHPDVSQLSRAMAIHMAIDQTTIGSFFEFRKVIEPTVAALAAAQAKAPQAALLEELASTQRSDNVGANEFHRALGDCIDNGIFRVLLNTLHAVLDLHVPYESLTEQDVSLQIRAHRKIAAKIAARDADAAADAMLRHLEAFEKIMAKQGRLGEPLVPRGSWGSA